MMKAEHAFEHFDEVNSDAAERPRKLLHLLAVKAVTRL
jgi:hypothetical protein